MTSSILGKYTFPTDCVYNPPSKGGGKMTGQAEIVLERKLTKKEIEQEKQERQKDLIAYAEWAMTRVCSS